jgi:hypothetical protein
MLTCGDGMLTSSAVTCPRLNKSLAALALLLFFSLGVFAVSLAHELPSGGPIHTIVLKDLMKNGPVRMDGHALALALECETWDICGSGQPPLEERRVGFSRRVGPLKPSRPAQTNTPKVTFQILESVLLI